VRQALDNLRRQPVSVPKSQRSHGTHPLRLVTSLQQLVEFLRCQFEHYVAEQRRE
jgi:hypothetical protein